MATDGLDVDTLTARFAELGRRDRKAVLAQLSRADRMRVESVLAAQEEARRREAERVRRAGRQFAAYSPWLSPIVEAECMGEGTATLRPSAARALAEAHRALQGEQEKAPAGMIARLREWGAALLGLSEVKQP